jgi:hypothetical protein
MKMSILLSLLSGNTKWGSITVPLTSILTGLDKSVLQTKAKNVGCHKADSKPLAVFIIALKTCCMRIGK